MTSIAKYISKARWRDLLTLGVSASGLLWTLWMEGWSAAAVMLGTLSVVVIVLRNASTHSHDAQRHLFQRSLEASSNGVMISRTDWPECPIVYANPAFTQLTGYPVEGTKGLNCQWIDTPPEQLKALRQALNHGEDISLTIRNYRKDGGTFWNNLFISPVRNNAGNVTHFIGILNDISERKHQENQRAFHATHDALTGLGNRALFEDHLHHDMELARRHKQQIAVLFIDMDEFKPINDTLGHATGDKILIDVAQRLKAQIRPSDTLCRFGGDEFILLLPDITHPLQAEELAQGLLERLALPYQASPHELYLSASIGIAVSHDRLDNPTTLIQQADMAMYKAKSQGRNTFKRFTDELNIKLTRRVTLKNDLHDAISEDQLDLYYQPQIHHDGTLKGVEALLRWQHPVKGMISPASFIPLAEQTGQIIALEQWVMKRVARDLSTLTSYLPRHGRVAINLSPTQFHRPDFLSTIVHILETTELPIPRLEFELTESALLKNVEGAIESLMALREMGAHIAIDDFGTGFSSLNYLRHLPLDLLKIDRSFITHLPNNAKDTAVVNGIIDLAHHLDIRVVAEGIETECQFHALQTLDCDVFQGYFFAYPMALADLIEWLEKRSN